MEILINHTNILGDFSNMAIAGLSKFSSKNAYTSLIYCVCYLFAMFILVLSSIIQLHQLQCVLQGQD